MALTDNLLAFYKLSDLSDSSGNNRTLTNNGNVSFASGKIGNAAVFDGSNYLNRSGSNLTAFGANDFAISCFYKPAQMTEGYASVICTYNNWLPTNGGLAIMDRTPSGDIAKFNIYLASSQTGETFIYNSLIDVVDGNWYHLTLTRNAGQIKFFVNGELQFNESNSTEFNEDLLFVGCTGDLAGNPIGHINGSIDAVGIWNRALSDSEVAALYNSGNGLELEGSAAPTLVKMQAPVKFFGKVKFGV